jgi:hypothetical protein
LVMIAIAKKPSLCPGVKFPLNLIIISQKLQQQMVILDFRFASAGVICSG